MKKGNVYIVHCIDTEGPLYEAPEVPFERLKEIFGIEIEPSVENLKKLQKGEIPLNGKEEAVMNLLDSKKITTRGDWQKIDVVLKKIMSPEYRNILKDSAGNGWKYSWFCMDHVGFTGNNPRRRDAGFHKIYDHYRKIVDEQNLGDTVQFHHHPVSFSGNFNESGTGFWGRSTLNDILTRDIIDRQWFPCAFRPGFHTERPDSNFFLEQWIPFDYANQSCKGLDTDQPDCSDGRFGDWRHAPLEWFPYHPDHDDYQKKGFCRRYITRCLNMYARLRMITEEDVRDAFEQADNGQNAILAFTDHDYKDMEGEIEYVRDLIKKVSEECADVNFYFENCVDAMRKCLELKKEELNLDMQIKENMLVVKSQGKVFGPQPFLAIKANDGKYYWDNFDFYDKNEWHYTFDNNTVTINDLEAVGVAANGMYGNTEIMLYNRQGGGITKTLLHP